MILERSSKFFEVSGALTCYVLWLYVEWNHRGDGRSFRSQDDAVMLTFTSGKGLRTMNLVGVVLWQQIGDCGSSIIHITGEERWWKG
jgi:hypothetical protein